MEKNWDKLDFVLGSVHYLERDDQMFDSVPAGAEQFAGRDIDEIYADYFRRVREMAASGLVDCLAHLDLIKIHGHRPKAEIEALVGETLDFIRVARSCDRAFHRRLAQTGERTLSVRCDHSSWRWRKEFHSRLHPMRIRTCSLAKITIAWPRRWSS